jgi:TetR/AcrR family transcriptional regulator, lmrAB and yxaGH operons repressor
MRPAKVDAERVSDGLLEGFRAGGYAGASLRDLTVATGLKSASLYHRFASGKVDMALAALDRAGEAFSSKVIAPLEGNGDATSQLEQSARGVDDFYQSGQLKCVLAVMLLSDAPPPVRLRVASMFAGWQAALAATLARAGSDRASTLAEDRIAAIQGALIIMQAKPDSAAFERAVAQLRVAP